MKAQMCAAAVLFRAVWPNDTAKRAARAADRPWGTVKRWVLGTAKADFESVWRMAERDAALRAEMIAALRRMEGALDGIEAGRLAHRQREDEAGGGRGRALGGDRRCAGTRGAAAGGAGGAPGRAVGTAVGARCDAAPSAFAVGCAAPGYAPSRGLREAARPAAAGPGLTGHPGPRGRR